MPYNPGSPSVAIDPNAYSKGVILQQDQLQKSAELDKANAEAEQARQDQATQQAFSQALQQTGDDYDKAFTMLDQQGHSTVGPRTALAKYRAELAKSAQEQLHQHMLEDDLVGRVVPTMVDQPSWERGLGYLKQIEPDAGWDQMLGPTFDQGKLDQFKQFGNDAKTQAEIAKNGIKALSDGDYVKAAASMKATSHSDDDWNGAKTLMGRWGVPPAIMSHVEQMTPQELQDAAGTGPDEGKPEKLIATMTGGMTGPQGLAVAKYMKDNHLTSVLDVPQPVIDKLRRESAQAVHITTSPAAGAGASGLTPGEGGGLELAGTWARLTNGVPPGFRRGNSASAITNEAARQNAILGRTPVMAMQKAAIYQGDSKALANLQKMQAAAAAYESKAMAQLDIVDGISDQVWRTKSPLINDAILAGKVKIEGDDDATLLLNAIQTASTEYAKIMMGGTGSAAAITDSAQKEAQKLLHAGMGQGTLRKATALMRKEMGLTMNGYDVAQQHIAENMAAAAGGQTQAATDHGGAAPPAVQAILANQPPSKPGKAYRMTDGTRWVKAADGSLSKVP